VRGQALKFVGVHLELHIQYCIGSAAHFEYARLAEEDHAVKDLAHFFIELRAHGLDKNKFEVRLFRALGHKGESKLLHGLVPPDSERDH
jgi:hypothetical protein